MSNIIRYILNSLRDYQQEAANNTNEIFDGKKDPQYDRFAAIAVPTGGGKSFIAMNEMITINNPDYNQKENNEIINDFPIIYIAPSNPIIYQIKTHIVKNIILDIDNLESMTLDQINNLIRRDFPEIKDFEDISNEDGITDQSSAEEKKNVILRKIDVNNNNKNKLVKKAFPNLIFRCYAGIKEIENLTEIVDDEIRDKVKNGSALIIVDEAHRSGAKEWGPNLEALIKKLSNCKVLAITATPNRNDKDAENAFDIIAKMVYQDTIEEVPYEKYIAKEIFVLDAMRDGIVNSPNVVEFNSSFANSDEYLEILNKYYLETDKNKKEKLEKKLSEMEEIIGFSPRDYIQQDGTINEEKKETIIEERRREELQKSKDKLNMNGKYIAFIPQQENLVDEKGKKLKGKEKKEATRKYYKDWEEKIRKQFKGITDNITFEYISSDFSDKENEDALNKFENSDKGGIKILLSIDKINEGVHVSGIDGCLMYRNVGKDKINKFLQQCGRCISSLDPRKTLSEQKQTTIFDFVGNFYTHRNTYKMQKVSHKHNLEKITEISKWIQEKNNSNFPDINSEDEKEARYAITLKLIKNKYKKFFENGQIPEKNREYIEGILEQAEKMNLFKIDIPIRTQLPSEEDLIGKRFFKFTKNQKDFNKLYYEVKEITKLKEVNSELRIKKLINILRVLKMHNPDLELPEGMEIQDIYSKKFKHCTLEQFINKNFSKEQIEQIMEDLQDIDMLDAESNEIYHPGEKYDLAGELAFARGMFWVSGIEYEKYGKSVFENFSPEELIKLDIVDYKHFSRMQNEIRDLFGVDLPNSKFITPKRLSGTKRGTLRALTTLKVLEKFAGISYETFTKYGPDGYDIEGYDEEGYDREKYNKYNFNRDNIHKITNQKYNERGFYWDNEKQKYINMYSNSEYDLLGYNIDDKDSEGKKRIYPTIKREERISSNHIASYEYQYSDGKWYEIKGDSLFYYEGIPEGEYNYEGLNGFDNRGFKKVEKNGEIKYIHVLTSSEFDLDGYNVYNFNKDFINKRTMEKYDERGFYWNDEKQKYINMYSNSEYDLLGYNIDGYNREGKKRPTPIIEERLEKSTIRYEHYRDDTWKKKIIYRNFTQEEGDVKELPKGIYNIEGFNAGGFKEIKLENGKTKYIHILTSSEWDPYGRKCVKNKEGKITLKKDYNISKAQLFINQFIGENKSLQQIEQDIKENCGLESTQEANKFIGRILNNAFILSIRYPKSINGSFIKAFLHNGNEQKIVKINQFFDEFPKVKENLKVLINRNFNIVLYNLNQEYEQNGEAKLDSEKFKKQMRDLGIIEGDSI